MAKSYYCFLEKFNNYFNRKIIRYDTLAEYETASNDHYIPVDSNSAMVPFDFNPNDEVTTEIIGNDLEFKPDYFLELDASQNILSRWFIVEQRRNRQGQWLYSLKRDVISDNIESLLNSPIFVQKGIVGDDNPLILNSEGMNFNQIKTEETLLKDKTGTSWYVGYIAKSTGGQDLTEQVPSSDITNAVSLRTIAEDLGTTEAILSDLLNFDGMNTYPARFIRRIVICYDIKDGPLYHEVAHYYKTSWNKSSYVDNLTTVNNRYLFASNSPIDTINAFDEEIYNNKNLLDAQILDLVDQDYYFTKDSSFSILKSYQNKIIHYLGKYYKLKIVESGTSVVRHHSNFSYSSFTSLKKVAEDTASNASSQATLNSTGNFKWLETNASKVYIQMEEISDASVIPTLDAQISTNRKVTQDQQYDMFVIPAGPMSLIYDDNGTPTQIETNGDYARRIITALALKYDAEFYDIQLLPYCPIDYLEDGAEIQGTENEDFDYITTTGPRYIDVEKDVDVDNTSISVTHILNDTTVLSTFSGMEVSSGDAVTVDEYSYEIYSDAFDELSNVSISINDSTGIMTIAYTIDDNIADAEASKVIFRVKYHYESITKVANVIFYCESASFQQQLDYNLSIRDSMKIDSQCDMYRLLSPNYQGTFEFNVAKNGGSVDFFTAYCTYKPYTPFIKVCPSFSFVYGMDFNDNRGLICGGDFSLPRISSAWQSYQLNNKNYQNIFNRDIQNLDIEQSLQARQQYITGGIGIGTDSIKGAMAGAMVGGGWGALAGGIIGAGTSAVGYGIDIDIMAKQHQEARSYAVDKYNYQLGNIKALPYTLTKVGAFDISSKIFPVLEYYTCSEQEKEALRRKIQYESMTIMAIGLFGDYYRAFDELKYFKGELIRCDDIADDTHVLDAIYMELLKGVYM